MTVVYYYYFFLANEKDIKLTDELVETYTGNGVAKIRFMHQNVLTPQDESTNEILQNNNKTEFIFNYFSLNSFFCSI